MAITLKQAFHVKAPVDAVWRFLLDPEQVVACMPGAALDEVVDGDTFLGNIKVKVGPIVASYKGRVHFARVDHEQHIIEMTAEGTEASGGSASGTMSSRVRPSLEGGAEVMAEANAEVTGRVMQFGRGMIQGVSEQIFRQFAARVSEELDRIEAGAERDEPPPPAEQKPINAVSLVFSTFWAAIVRLFRRVLRRSSAERP